MSFAVDAANKVHDRQVEAVTRSQDLTLKSLEKLTALQQAVIEKVPSAPGFVTGPIATVAQPLAAVVGTPSDYRAHLTQSAREWLTLRERFQSALLDLVAPTVMKAAPVKKAAAQKA